MKKRVDKKGKIKNARGQKKDAINAQAPSGGIKQAFLKGRKITCIIPLLIIIAIAFLSLAIHLYRNRNTDTLKDTRQDTLTLIEAKDFIQILPTHPSIRDILCVHTEFSWNAQSLKYTWYRNGLVVEGIDDNCLTNRYFKRGDVIFVKVIPVQSNSPAGEGRISESVIIKNTPPTVKGLSFQPENIFANTDVYVNIEALDLDNDLIRFRYKWFNNGEIINGETSNVLPSKRFKKGDIIQVEVLPNDGEEDGIPVRSGKLLVNNTPPVITSNPPNELVLNRSLIYQIAARDIDNDILQFFISPGDYKGLKINAVTGLLTWDVPEDIEHGEYRIEVIVKDGDGGETFQWITLKIERVTEPANGLAREGRK